MEVSMDGETASSKIPGGASDRYSMPSHHSNANYLRNSGYASA
jgi:hypothetical protein